MKLLIFVFTSLHCICKLFRGDRIPAGYGSARLFDQCKELQLIPHNISPTFFKSLLELAVKESIFIFNNKLYQQIDGVPMGSPLGPTLANTFFCYHEKKWLDNCPPEFRPLKNNRYVDDWFLVLREKEYAGKFLDCLNSKHANISYTVEHEVDNVLPFLDIRIYY